MRRSAATHLNFILCKYYDFITADLKVYSDRKLNEIKLEKLNEIGHFVEFF